MQRIAKNFFFADYVFKNDCELFQHGAPLTQVRANYQKNCRNESWKISKANF